MIFDVFVSHRHADTDSVRPVVQALRDSGLNVWIDEMRFTHPSG